MISPGVRREPQWLGEPRGLTILFFTQMWEQFSYYGMRALLVYYMTKQLLLDQAHASYVYGFYTAFAYFTPIFGGVIADRWLGRRRAVIIGGATMALGHFMMTQEPLFYLALATIALGNGLFLPSLPSQIGDLYERTDPRRGWAFNVYYVGINLGGFLAPLICGTLGEVYGWHYGLGAAGIGMTIGLAVYIAGQPYLPPERREPPQEIGRTRPATGAPVALLLVAIWIATTVFRGSYEQVGNTIALWADAAADRDFLGFTIPLTWFQSLNPLIVILFTPVLLHHWRRRAEANGEMAPVRKMAAGALIVGLSYALLAVVDFTAQDGRVNWSWLALFFIIFTIGELYTADGPRSVCEVGACQVRRDHRRRLVLRDFHRQPVRRLCRKLLEPDAPTPFSGLDRRAERRVGAFVHDDRCLVAESHGRRGRIGRTPRHRHIPLTMIFFTDPQERSA